ncbi:preprotein translocase subunit YajC [Candidatus Nitrosacidococcus tergens]|uniref:Sec translocon accessory complex subunit YajC n=1 Tax=Candidatus Nitrosacidococcus tergens TaxID=553981 RepID=A0A7G1QB69_9GAMM|nr:preprotein translocase subunit YajC [Candidatus Nitrosacidococcus tergens]CAB1276493.1 conserved protein of unknown function [Candidatus Nitrosacidococcus tergens]
MNFFITDAWAEGSKQAVNNADFLLPMIVFATFFLVYYFFIIRPRLKRQKERLTMLGTVKKGDEIITYGGLLGKVLEVGNNFLQVELAEGIQVKVEKHGVSRVVPKGTMKNL